MINAQPIELYNRPSQVSKADLRAADELATLWRLAVAGQVAVADAAAALGLTKVQANNRISYLKRKGYAAPQIVQAVDLGRSLGYPPCPKCGRRDTERFENMIYCAGGCAHTWQPPTPPPAAANAPA